MSSKLEEVPFTNNIGQIINPGDRIIAVTTGYSHRVSVREGTYVGMVGLNPSVVVKTSQGGRWDSDGRKLSWSEAQSKGVAYSFRQVDKRTTLRKSRVYKIV